MFSFLLGHSGYGLENGLNGTRVEAKRRGRRLLQWPGRETVWLRQGGDGEDVDES